MRSTNADYEIVHHVDIGDKHFVTGHNPSAPAAFVTWEYIEKGDYFYQGHYFTNQEDAILDMFQRAGRELDLNGKSLGMALLSQEDRQELGSYFREEAAAEQIAYVLEDLLSDKSPKYDIDGLLADQEFMLHARHRYDNIDHSYENEALAEALEDVLEGFPKYKIPEVKTQAVEVKIPPEKMAIVQELLSLPTAQIREKYGPLGDNLEFPFYLDEYKAILEIVPSYDPGDKLSTTCPHYVQFHVFNENGRSFSPGDVTLINYDQAKSFADFILEFGCEEVKFSLEEDESLRRIGNQFVFKAVSEESCYSKHDGEVCTVQRALTPAECDIFVSGLMWAAEFPNGEVLYVFDRELQQPHRERKPSLNQQIAQAQGKTDVPSAPSKDHSKSER